MSFTAEGGFDCSQKCKWGPNSCQNKSYSEVLSCAPSKVWNSKYLYLTFLQWWKYLKISECLCNQYGSVDGQCDPTLKDRCKCKQTFDGAYCDVCSAGYFDFPNCSRKFMAKHTSGILKNILCV